MIDIRYDCFVEVPDGFYRSFHFMPKTIFVSLSDYEKLKDEPAYIETLSFYEVQN